MRIVWLLAGLLAVALGLLGAALPVLPTVPFMLVAAFCFARSSPRLDAWIVNHPRFGRAVRDWRAHGVAPRRAKWASAIGMSAGLVFSALAGLPPLALAGQAAVMIAVSAWVWRLPETPPEPSDPASE